MFEVDETVLIKPIIDLGDVKIKKPEDVYNVSCHGRQQANDYHSYELAKKPYKKERVPHPRTNAFYHIVQIKFDKNGNEFLDKECRGASGGKIILTDKKQGRRRNYGPKK